VPRPLVLLAFALAGCAAVTPAPSTDAGASLAAAESAFAAQSVREGMRAAFLAWLADDAILFRDGPVNGPATIAARPDPPIVLDWRPAYVEVAASGEMGLSTGPWRITSKAKPGAPPTYGQFVSVWKRRGDGTWRNAVDLGISHEGAALWDAALAITRPPAVPPVDPSATIAAAEATFAARSRESGTAAAFGAWAAESIRMYRDDHAPLLGRSAVLGSPAVGPARIEWIIERTETSRAGDLGYALGRYAGVTDGATRGHYVRIWRREPLGWRIALDVVNPLAPR
jgi:ketosteroid isomerase-like protein